MTLKPIMRKGAGAQNPGHFARAINPESTTELSNDENLESEAEQLHVHVTLDDEWFYASVHKQESYRRWVLDAREYCAEHGIDFQTYLHDDHYLKYSAKDRAHL